MWNAIIQKAVAVPKWCYGAAAFVGVILIVVLLNNQQNPAAPPPKNEFFNSKNPVIPLPVTPGVEQTINTAGNASKEIAEKGAGLAGKIYHQADQVVGTTGKVVDSGARIVDHVLERINPFVPEKKATEKKKSPADGKKNL